MEEHARREGHLGGVSVAEADEIEATRVAHILFILIVALIALVDAAAYYFLPLPETVRQVLFISDSFCALILLGSVVARWALSPSKWGFLLPWGLLDLVGSVPGLPFLRFLSLPHVIRVGSQLRRTTPEEVRMLGRRRLAESTLLVVVAIMLVLVTACSVAIVLVEAGAPRANIVTGDDAVWWALVTVATVGYGDYYPVTRWGRIIGVALMFGGVTLFSVLTSFIAASFVKNNRASASEIAALRRALEETRKSPTPADEPPRDRP
jgi:voltage-gated potassium channel